MIPYFEWHTIPLGPITLQVWGLLVGLGFILGTYVATRLAKVRGADTKVIVDLVPWLIFGAIVGGRLGDVFLYRPGYYFAHPLEIFMVWKGGASLFGGLIACTIIAIVYFSKRKVNVLKYADILAFGLPAGMACGRIGCFLIHDHPGTLTSFVLGVKYPDGVRHDLGLYEALFTGVIAVIFFTLGRKVQREGFYLALFCILYSIPRFLLDFLRINDVRYAHLTPSQYLCILLLGFGIWRLYHIFKQVPEQGVDG
jgi:phosphatidylglycerol:prolipoprotein diacylglycerol transferase